MRWLIPFLLMVPMSAAAQQVDAQKLVAALQQQRNKALDDAALATVRAEVAEAKTAQLQAELEKLKTKDEK